MRVCGVGGQGEGFIAKAASMQCSKRVPPNIRDTSSVAFVFTSGLYLQSPSQAC